MLKKSVVLKQIREQCERGIRYTKALQHINIDGVIRKVNPQTLENWRNTRPMLNRYIRTVINLIDEKRTNAVEDKLMDRLLKGESAPVEYIFYLKNRRPDRWRDRQEFIHSGITLAQVIKNVTNGNADIRRTEEIRPDLQRQP